MKKSTIVWAIVAVCALGGGLARGETAEGRSRNFPVDTRCKEFVIADVKSAYCSGAYGMKGGKRAIFLQGVEAQVAFTVTALGNNVKLTRVTANGRDFEGAKFIYDVGALPVGGKLMVVGYGEVDGVEAESAPFMVNLDVVWPLMVYGLTGLDLDFAGEQGYREKGATQFEIGSDALSSSNHPGWLPEGVTQFSPLVAFRTDYSEDNGAFVFSPRAHSSRGTKKIPSQRSNGMLGKSFGIGYEMQADGGMTFQWLPEARGWLAKRAALTGEVGGQMEFMWPFTVPTPVGGIPAFAEVEVAAEAKTRLAYRFPGVVDGMSQAASWNWTLSGAKMPTLSGDLGVGGTPLADVKGWVAATGVLAGTIDGSDDSRIQYGVRGKLSGTVDALGWRAKISTDPATHWILGGEDTDDAMGEVKVEWGPMGREYWKRPGASGATVMGGVTGGYPNPSPSAAWGGGADWMAYLRDDGTRGNADRTEVVVQPGAGGKWGAVERPWNDGTADWMPSLSVAGDGTAVLAWANEKRAWGASAGFEDMCRGLELAVGVRDAKKRCWAVQNLTDDEAADAGAVVRAAGDGTAMVAWLRNASGALFGDAERPTDVMASWWNGSEWSAPEVVAAKVGAVSGLDLAYDGTNACAVWAFDGDGDWMTHGDMAVGAAIWIGGGWEDPTTTEEDGEGALPVVSQVDQNGYLATAGVETEEEEEGWTNGVWKAAVAMAAGLESASPVVARVDGIGAVALWNAGGVLMERTADGTEKARAASVAWNGDIPGTARVAHGAGGTLGLAWTSKAGGTSQAVVMGYDADMGCWGGPVAVGDGEAGRMVRNVSAAWREDGALCAAWASVEVATNAAGGVAFGNTELHWGSVSTPANPRVLADGFSFAPYEVTGGTMARLTVTVENPGSTGVSEGRLRVWVCDGELEKDEEARWELVRVDGEVPVLDLPGGARVEEKLWWMADDFRTNLTFVARLELPEEAEDADPSDNEARWSPGGALLRLKNARCEAVGTSVRLLTATVRNVGLAEVSAGTVVSFRLEAPTGEEVGRDVVGAVRAGDAYGYDAGITWDMAGKSWTGAWTTVYAVIQTGNAKADAAAAVPICVMTPLDRDGDGLLDGEEMSMGTDPELADTNGDGVSDYKHVYVFFSNPLEGLETDYTTTTPVPVPHEWLDQYPDALAEHEGDYEAFATEMAGNGTNRVWECYLAGTDPTVVDEEFNGVIAVPERNYR